MKKKCCLLFNVIFAVLFTFLFLGTLFHNQSTFLQANPLWMIGSMILILGVWFIIFWLIQKGKEFSLKKEIIVVSVIFVLFAILQGVFAYFLAVEPSWDFGMVYNGAKAAVTHSSFGGIISYFEMCPNNLFPFYCLTIFYKIISFFGISNFLEAGMFLNIILIDISILGIYLSVRKLKNKKVALFSLIICFFLSPFFLYVPIFYTDTLSMLFPIWILCLYFHLPKTEKINKKFVILLIILSILSFIGMKMKMTVLIVTIALGIDFILKTKRRIFIPSILIIGTILSALTLLYRPINQKITKNFDEEKALPYDHYFMMGLSKQELNGTNRYAYGIFSQEDLSFTLSFDTKEQRVKNNRRVFLERISNYGIAGSLDFFYNKSIQTFGDGTYFAPEKLRRNPLQENTKLHQIYLAQGKYFPYYFYFAQGVQLCLLLLTILSCLFLSRKEDKRIDVVRIAVFGIFLFLLLWESRSRYIVNYIPLFVLCATVGMNGLYKKINKNIGSVGK